MTRKLRQGNGTNGLILANGGVMTYQHVICLSSKPRADGQGYSSRDAVPLKDAVPIVDEVAEGEAIIEVEIGTHATILAC
jgi:hypothetical protein